MESSGDVDSALASPSSFYIVEEIIGDIVRSPDADISAMRTRNFTNFEFEVREPILELFETIVWRFTRNVPYRECDVREDVIVYVSGEPHANAPFFEAKLPFRVCDKHFGICLAVRNDVVNRT